MSIHQLLKDDAAFNPEEIAVIAGAFEDALERLRLVRRSDPLAEMVAQKVIELAKRGERDRQRLCEQVVAAFSPD
ncbi:MAG TPA: hypothetical protein VGF60_04605 [Xanthobacteraceae bacterium]|jgi:hypothetical protein